MKFFVVVNEMQNWPDCVHFFQNEEEMYSDRDQAEMTRKAAICYGSSETMIINRFK
jgi:hypothetical protein